jgi:hypothetical protein
MPKKKSTKGNTKNSKSGSDDSGSAKAASLSTSRLPIPRDESLLLILEVMESVNATFPNVKDMLEAGQWLLKDKNGHKKYYRYVIIEGRVQVQTVTHSSTSGSSANKARAGDLRRMKYTSDGGVESVIRSDVVIKNPSLYPP